MADNDKMEFEVEYGKDGKPTKESMKKAFEYDKELFLDLQEKHFGTKGGMGDDNLRKKIMKMFKKGKD